MKKFDFENLDVYQLTIDFIDRVFDLFEAMPYSMQNSIGNNLLRAAVSIGNNIAEGSGRRGRKEKRHSFEISQGSAFECIPMLTILHKKRKMSNELFEKLYDDCYAISKMLSGLIKRFS